jgi:hypothetical protein
VSVIGRLFSASWIGLARLGVHGWFLCDLIEEVSHSVLLSYGVVMFEPEFRNVAKLKPPSQLSLEKWLSSAECTCGVTAPGIIFRTSVENSSLLQIFRHPNMRDSDVTHAGVSDMTGQLQAKLTADEVPDAVRS